MSWLKKLMAISMIGWLYLAGLHSGEVEAQSDSETITLGSKMFTESYILAEMMAQLLEASGYTVKRRLGLGGTLVAYQALANQAIDVYPEYTGTISQVILNKDRALSLSELESALAVRGLEVLPRLGFNNSYALAVRRRVAEQLSLESLDDLRGNRLKAVFNFEFMEREDGWKNLKPAYDLDLDIKNTEHTMSYEAIGVGQADVVVVYSTDAKIEKFDLVPLADPKGFFPSYEALPLAHKGLPDSAREVIAQLEGRIDDKEMRQMNAQAELKGKTYAQVAREFLIKEGLIDVSQGVDVGSGWMATARKILRLSAVHLYLVFFSTFMAVLVAVPLGVLLFRTPSIAKPALYIVGLLQTIPSIALLVYMIPWLGVTVEAALMALFLYSLLPILQNTFSGLKNVDPLLKQAARGIGLYPWEILIKVEVPLAAPIIMAGIRTAAVINVGTATIAAFIGSGGLGELIVQGLTLNNISLMQQGAIPAAVLAIVINIVFSSFEKRLQLT